LYFLAAALKCCHTVSVRIWETRFQSVSWSWLPVGMAEKFSGV